MPSGDRFNVDGGSRCRAGDTSESSGQWWTWKVGVAERLLQSSTPPPCSYTRLHSRSGLLDLGGHFSKLGEVEERKKSVQRAIAILSSLRLGRPPPLNLIDAQCPGSGKAAQDATVEFTRTQPARLAGAEALRPDQWCGLRHGLDGTTARAVRSADEADLHHTNNAFSEQSAGHGALECSVSILDA